MTDDAMRVEADALDRAIDRALGYRDPDGWSGATPSDGHEEHAIVVRHLAVLHEAPTPPGLSERVAASMSTRRAPQRTRRIWPVRAFAAALGVSFLVQGGPALFASERLSRFLGLVHEPHIYREGGIMALAIGAALVLAALRPRFLATAVIVGVPIALGLGIFGAYEIGHAPNPGAEVLHLTQAALALGLLAVWRRRRRV